HRMRARTACLGRAAMARAIVAFTSARRLNPLHPRGMSEHSAPWGFVTMLAKASSSPIALITQELRQLLATGVSFASIGDLRHAHAFILEIIESHLARDR